MNGTSAGRRVLVRLVLAALTVPAFLALGAPLAAGADPSISSIGSPTSSAPSNTASASGPQSSGQTTVCLNGQQSQVNPAASTATDTVQVNNTTCTAAGSASNAPTSGPSSGGSSSGGSGGSESHVASTQTASAQTRASVVEAANASQLRIAAIRFTTKRVRRAKKLGLVVTLRGQQGSLVRSGIVSISGAPGAKLACKCRLMAYSNQLGQAAFTIPVSRPMFGKRLYLQVTARTPTLRTSRLISVRLPGRRPRG